MSEQTCKDMKEAHAKPCELCSLSPNEGNRPKERAAPLLVDGQE